jgi:hypothetical protein
MKNIHLIPTDKPSRLIFDKKEDRLLPIQEESFWMEHQDLVENQNMYITSDAKIKEGVNQWYLDKFLNKPRNSNGAQYVGSQNVIILTTDQDLIKDGVQAIDDEFLEWFVKNPSCGEIQVEKSFHWDNGVYEYEIIIPKEEPKQIDEKGNPLTYWGGLEEPKQIYQQIIDVVGGEDKFKEIAKIKPKQETLEEAAEKFIENIMRYSFNSNETRTFANRLLKCTEFGAKWQQERMYSEEDMNKYADYVLMCSAEKTFKLPLQPKEWFEQFKKIK